MSAGSIIAGPAEVGRSDTITVAPVTAQRGRVASTLANFLIRPAWHMKCPFWRRMKTRTLVLTIGILVVLTACAAPPQFSARDPGVRGGPAGAGNSFTTLTAAQKA